MLIDRNKVCVAILNYNGRRHLEEFLPEVCKAVSSELIVVIDNGSTDESLYFLEDKYPEIERVILDVNHGFAEGYNLGLKGIDAEYYLLMNSDIAPAIGFLEKMLEYIETNSLIAAVQPTVLSYLNQDTYEYAGASGGMLDSLRYPLCRGRILSTVTKYNPNYKNIEIFWATGACMLVRAKVFNLLGGFAGHYFAHMEEIDLCWRMKRLGYRIEIVTDAKVFHLGGGTLSYNSPNKTFLNFRNSLFTLVRNESKRNLLWLLPTRFVLDCIASAMFFIKGERGNSWAVFRARYRYFIKLRQVYRERKEIKKIIAEHRIAKDRSSIGILNKSIVFNYYLRAKHHYSEIFNNEEKI